ncbi:MAG: hypothetical protein ACRDE5_10285, partial [Ginsengibacter sp.]
MTKKENELFILNLFKEIYSEFPVGNLEHDDRPDFIVVNGERKIGIEIAEIFQDSHLQKGSMLKQREGVQSMFGEGLLKLLISKLINRTSFMLSIDFNNKNPYGVNQIDDIIDKCWIEPMEFLWNNSYGKIRIENDEESLPKEI